MAFVVSKLRHFLWISISRVSPKSKARPFLTNSCHYRSSRSCHSTENTSPEKKSKSTNTHRANKSLSYSNSQISKHGRSGSVRKAEKVFARMVNKDVISRISMVTMYGQNGEIEKARKVFDEMPERITASYNAMITAYGKSKGMTDEAFEIFSAMPERNAVSYGAMILTFVRARMFAKAEKLFYETPREFRDPVCSSMLLQGYLRAGNLSEAYRIFVSMAVRDVVSWSSMVDGYCKAGRIIEAQGFFDVMPNRNVVTWTSMIGGYLKHGNFDQGFELFSSMRREKTVEVNSDTLAVVFGGCGNFWKHKEGFQIHGLVPRIGFNCEGFLGNSMVTMYSRLGDMDSATKIFHEMIHRDVVSWNTLIYGYAQCDNIDGAWEFFEKMPKKNAGSWMTMISRLFSRGSTERAVHLFKTMPVEKDGQSWATLISGLVKNGKHEKAFRWFAKMLWEKDISLDPHAVCSVVSASASLNQGTQIHALVIKKNMESELSIKNALSSMYSNCGSVLNLG